MHVKASRGTRRLQGHSRKLAEVNASFHHRPQVRCTQYILRPLSRIRAELAGGFSRWLYVEGLFMTQSKSAPAGEQAGTKHTADAKNIVDTAIGAGNFTTLAAGIKAAGLTDTFAGQGPYTVFAPTDEAFKKLPAGAVDALL